MVQGTKALTGDRELWFPEGIPGFAGARRFLLTDLTEDRTFQLLQSLDDPELSMVVGMPWLFFPDYAPDLDDSEQQALDLERAEDAVVFCAVTADDDGDSLYLNLLGPFVVNARTRVGRQVVLDDPELPVRAPVTQEF